MQSIDRAMTIAKVLVTQENGFVYFRTSRRSVNFPLSTLHRLLKAMIKQGMVQQDKRTKSIASVQFGWNMVYKSMTQWIMLVLIRPELERLMRDVDESVYLQQTLGMEALIIERN